MWYIYILTCKDGSLYTGITTDVSRRFNEHKNKTGGHYTRSHPVKSIAYTEKAKTQSKALKREYQIKNLKREEKLKLIKAKSL